MKKRNTLNQPTYVFIPHSRINFFVPSVISLNYLLFDCVVLFVENLNNFLYVNKNDKEYIKFWNAVCDGTVKRPPKFDSNEGFYVTSLELKRELKGDKKIIRALKKYTRGIQDTPIKSLNNFLPTLKSARDSHDLPPGLKQLYEYFCSDKNKWNTTMADMEYALLSVYISMFFINESHSWSPGPDEYLLHHIFQDLKPVDISSFLKFGIENKINSLQDLLMGCFTHIIASEIEDVNRIMRIEVPKIDDVPLIEIIKLKKLDKLNSITHNIKSRLDKYRNDINKEKLVLETIHKDFCDLAHKLMPKKGSTILGITGSLPTGFIPINPISVITLVKGIIHETSITKDYDWIIELNKLKHL